MNTILVIEGGGSGYRAAEIAGKQIKTFNELPINSVDTERLISFAADCAKQINARAIGVSTSGFVTEDGIISLSTNTGLPPNLPLEELIAKATGLPTKVVNDLVAATRGASTVFPDLPVFLMANVGGGVGQRKYDRGRIEPFDERGHMTLDLSPDAPLCYCGVLGCAESFLGGNNLKNLVIRWGNDLPHDMHPCAYLDQQFVAKTDGTDWAKDIYFRFAEMLGVYLANLQLHDNVRDIVFRGTTVTKALRLPDIEPRVRKAMRARLPDVSMANVKFHFLPKHPKGVKDWDAYLGAAAFAQDLLAAR